MPIQVIMPDMGQSIEEKMRLITATKAPIENVVPMIYTARNEGVKPEFDIRTDRFEIALEAMNKFAASGNAHREEMHLEELNKPQEKTTPENK